MRVCCSRVTERAWAFLHKCVHRLCVLCVHRQLARRRDLDGNHISGTLPASLSALTALQRLCADRPRSRHAFCLCMCVHACVRVCVRVCVRGFVSDCVCGFVCAYACVPRAHRRLARCVCVGVCLLWCLRGACVDMCLPGRMHSCARARAYACVLLGRESLCACVSGLLHACVHRTHRAVGVSQAVGRQPHLRDAARVALRIDGAE